MLASTHKSLLLQTLVVLSCLCSAIGTPHDLQGTYRIARLLNATRDSINLGNETFTFKLDFDHKTANGSFYSFGTTIGNVIAGSLVLDEGTGTVSDTMSWSTRMYPGPELYAIEVALLDVIDQAAIFKQRFENNTLVLTGRGGTLVLRDMTDDSDSDSPIQKTNNTETMQSSGRNSSTGGTRRLRH